MLKVLIVDDSRLFRSVLRKILSNYYEIVGEAEDGISGYEMAAKFQPDIVLLDVTMPNCDGKECLEKIVKLSPASKVIMISSVNDQDTVKSCLEIGAVDFLNKSALSAVDLNSNKEVLTKLEKLTGDRNESVA